MKYVLLIIVFICAGFTRVPAQDKDPDSASCGCLPKAATISGLEIDSATVSASTTTKERDSLRKKWEQLRVKAVDSINAKRIGIRLDLIKSFNDMATTFLGWCLLIVGGTILALVNTGYRYPLIRSVRWTYIIFLPGWIFLAITMNTCLNIEENYLGAKAYGLNNCIQMCTMKEATEGLYSSLNFTFRTSLLIFGAWLVLMLFIWILAKPTTFQANSATNE